MVQRKVAKESGTITLSSYRLNMLEAQRAIIYMAEKFKEI